MDDCGSITTMLTRNVPDNFATFHTGEFGVEPLELEGERLVLNAELIQHGGVQIVDGADFSTAA